jgi:hypothetical protein
MSLWNLNGGDCQPHALDTLLSANGGRGIACGRIARFPKRASYAGQIRDKRKRRNIAKNPRGSR